MFEEYIYPSKETYTIYSKSGCPNCTKSKNLLKNENPVIINCDDYLIENKEEFLFFIRDIIGKEYKIFPMIFHKEKFIGGFNEIKDYYEKINAFSEI